MRVDLERQLNAVTEELQRCKSRLDNFEREKIVDQEELQIKLFYNHQSMQQSLKAEYEQKLSKLQDEVIDLRRSSTMNMSGVFNSLPRCRTSKSSEKLV